MHVSTQAGWREPGPGTGNRDSLMLSSAIGALDRRGQGVGRALTETALGWITRGFRACPVDDD